MILLSFSSLCIANLNIALQRISQFKSLISPIRLYVNITSEKTFVTIDCYDHNAETPSALAAIEVVFFSALARLCARHHVKPIMVSVRDLPNNVARYKDYFGIEIKQGTKIQIAFSAKDSKRQFLTENATMWEFFDAGISQRLSDLEMNASTEKYVKSDLLKILPDGHSTLNEADRRLGMRKRTLQRKLSSEEENFQDILKNTRTELAQHYLSRSSMSTGEISFLLGFEDNKSFIRAYSGWAMQSPGQFRSLN